MENFRLEGSQNDPDVTLDAEQGLIKLYGRSIPEHAMQFYTPILVWIRNYVEQCERATTIHLELEHYNSSSKVFLLDILRTLAPLQEKGQSVVFNWYYEEDDEDAKDLGELFAGEFSFESHIIPVDEIG